MPSLATVTIFIQDAKSQQAKLIYRIDLDHYRLYAGNDAMLTAIDFWAEACRRLDLIINGRVASCSISIDVPNLPALKVAALLHSDVEEGATVIFPESAYSAYFKNTIPTYNHALFTVGETMDFFALSTDEREYFRLITQPEEVHDAYWNSDNGGIFDNRGNRVNNVPSSVKKSFKKSSKR